MISSAGYAPAERVLLVSLKKREMGLNPIPP